MTVATPTKVAKIFTLREEGLSERKIAKRLPLSQKTVNRVLNCPEKRKDPYYKKPKPGATSKLTDQEKRLVVRNVRSGKAHDAVDVHNHFYRHVSPSTIWRILRNTDLNAWVMRKKPFLHPDQIAKHLAWAIDHQNWTPDDWRKVVFSDESKFKIWGSDGRKWCWRRVGEAFDPRFVKPTVKHGGGRIMVWGCVTSKGVGRLHLIAGIMCAPEYVDILSTDLLGTFHDQDLDPRTLIFQQDGDSKHTSKLAKWFLAKQPFSVLPWPSSSPDMSIIEHSWDYVDRQICQRDVLPTSEENLWEILQEEWAKIPLDYINKLYDSLPHRVQELLNVKGSHTSY